MDDSPDSLEERASTPDSLFSEYDDTSPEEPHADGQVEGIRPSPRIVEGIPGLHIFPGVLPSSIARAFSLSLMVLLIVVSCLDSISFHDLFVGGSRDQVMLFSSPSSTHHCSSSTSETGSSIPPYLLSLLSEIRRLLEPHLPADLGSILWDQPLARQIILNLYTSGRGISAHVDLPHRYADGIVGVSLCGGCVMSFSRPSLLPASKEETVDVYLPPRTVYVLSSEARWDWAHSIPSRSTDVVLEEDGRRVTMIRETRVSVTFRWLKAGADELSEEA